MTVSLSPEKIDYIRELAEEGEPAGKIARLMRVHPNTVKAITDIDYIAHMRAVQRRTIEERKAMAAMCRTAPVEPQDAAAASRERNGGAKVPVLPHVRATIETRLDGTRYVTTHYTRIKSTGHNVSLPTISCLREPDK